MNESILEALDEISNAVARLTDWCADHVGGDTSGLDDVRADLANANDAIREASKS